MRVNDAPDDESVGAIYARTRARASIDPDPRLTPEGKRDDAQAAKNTATADVEKQLTVKAGGLDRQLTAESAALLAKAGKSVADPSPLRVQSAIQRLEGADPLEVAALYHVAEPDDQRLLEVAAEALGNQPVRRDGRLFWEPLLPPDTVNATVIARAEKIDAAGAAQLRDLMRIRNTFVAIAGVAKQLLAASLPSGVPTRVIEELRTSTVVVSSARARRALSAGRGLHTPGPSRLGTVAKRERNSMQTIHDPRFVKTLYRDFCGRAVTSAASKRALMNRRIEVADLGDAGVQIVIADSQGSLIELRWRIERAIPMRCLTVDSELMRADIDELSHFVGKFLKRHGLMRHELKKGA